jgi:pimeloyl-ACP methyl ester carboxylesterase
VPPTPHTVASTNGVDLAVHDLGGTGPLLLLSHATGFHGHCYVPLAHALADRFHSVAFDYRGHGDTALPADGTIDWLRYGDDAEAMGRWASARAGGPVMAFGHSMGGACLLMAAHRDPGLFDRLVLFEPIVFPPPDETTPTHDSVLSAGARRRRAVFPSYEAAIAHYAAKPPLDAFTPEALDAYVRYGFAEGPDGQVRLKCDPETEAGTFDMGGQHRTWDLLGEIEIPVMVVAGLPLDQSPSKIAAGIAEQLPNATYVQREDLDHFGPMTHPDVVAGLIADFAAAAHD